MLLEAIAFIFLILAVIAGFSWPERPYGFACLCVSVGALCCKVFVL